nr:MAG TPA: hypothetical protein [Caudoviricetes sp.]
MSEIQNFSSLDVGRKIGQPTIVKINGRKFTLVNR